MTRSLVGAATFALALAALPAGRASAAPVTWAANQHQYEAVLVSNGLGWIDAEVAAEARGCGWHLATIGSADENKFVFSLVKGKAAFFILGLGPWLGGYQKDSIHENGGDWAWVTGEDFSGYTNWAKGEPSNRTAGHQDVEPGVPPGQYESFLSHKLNGQWNDHHPEALFHGYVAESDAATQKACQSP